MSDIWQIAESAELSHVSSSFRDYSVSQNKVSPREKKILKILLIISELFLIYDINIYVLLSPVQIPSSLTFQFPKYDKLSKSTQNLKAWYAAIPTVTCNNKTNYLLLLDVNTHFCTQ